MATDITHRIKGLEPAPISPALSRSLAWHRNGLAGSDRGRIAADRALRPPEAAAFRRRATEIEDALAVRNDRTVATEIGKLLSIFPGSRVSAQEAAGVVAGYVAVLATVPPWAVARACGRWARGHVPGQSRTFAPSAAELLAEAETIVAPLAEEGRQIAAVLTATPELPSESIERRRAAVAAAKAAHGERFGMEAPEGVEPSQGRAFEVGARVTAAAQARAWAALGRRPNPMMSPELAGMLGVLDAPDTSEVAA